MNESEKCNELKSKLIAFGEMRRPYTSIIICKECMAVQLATLGTDALEAVTLLSNSDDNVDDLSIALGCIWIACPHMVEIPGIDLGELLLDDLGE